MARTEQRERPAPPEAVRLREGLITFPLDDELVVFCEDLQYLVSLNRSAVFVFRALEQGQPISRIEEDLAGFASGHDAKDWTAATIRGLDSLGLLASSSDPVSTTQARTDIEAKPSLPPLRRFEPAADNTYRLVETCARIRVEHPEQARMIDSVIGHLAINDDRAPTVLMEITAAVQSDGEVSSNIYRDGLPIAHVEKLWGLGPIVKSALWQSTVNANDFLFYIHAGVVALGDAGVILPAASGGGKSTLTAALTHAGFRFYSDEVALVARETFRVPPMPLAICSKKTGWKVMARYHPSLWDLPLHFREDMRLIRYIPPPPGATDQPPIPITHIVFPRYAEGSATELTKLSRAGAFGRLMSECLALRERLNPENVASMLQWMATIDCFGLVYSDLGEAVSTIKALIAQPAS